MGNTTTTTTTTDAAAPIQSNTNNTTVSLAEKLVIDAYDRRSDEIMKLLELATGEPSGAVAAEPVDFPGRTNCANFGVNGNTFCICERPGQVPCSAFSTH